MALQKLVERIKLKGGYFYVLEQGATVPIYQTVGYTEETGLLEDPTQEDVYDEAGDLVTILGGDEKIIAQPRGLQTTLAEIDLIRTLKAKDLKVLYLVPITSLGQKKIQQYEFMLARIVPKIELGFNPSKRVIPFEFHIQPKSTDVFGTEMNGSASILFENSDLIYKGISGDTALTNIISSGYKVTKIVAIASNMIAGDKLRIGTTPGGVDVVADTDISAGGIFDLTVTASTGPTLYAADDGSTTTPWAGSQNVDLYMKLETV